MRLDGYERKVLRRLRDGDGAGPFKILNSLEAKGAIKIVANRDEGEFIITVTDAGRAALQPRSHDE